MCPYQVSNELKEDKKSDHLSFATKKEVKADKSAVDINLVGKVSHSIDLTEVKRSDHIPFGTDKEVDADKLEVDIILIGKMSRFNDLTENERSDHLSKRWRHHNIHVHGS